MDRMRIAVLPPVSVTGMASVAAELADTRVEQAMRPAKRRGP